MHPINQVGSVPERTAGTEPTNSFGSEFTATEFTARRRGRLRRYLYERPRLTDAVVSVAYVLLSLPAVITEAGHGSWEQAIMVLVIGLLLLLRRRSPIVISLVFSGLETLILFTEPVATNSGLSLWFGLYAVALKYRARTAFLITAAVSVLPSYYFITMYDVRNLASAAEVGNQFTFGLITAVAVLLTNVVCTGIGISVRRSRDYDQALHAWAERNVRLASMAERTRIAREMHDVVAHSLTVMVALADGAAVAVSTNPGRAATVLGELSKTGRTALADMRRVLGVLREEHPGRAPLAPLPAAEDLEQLLRGFVAAGLPVTLTTAGSPVPSDPALALTIHRIIGEALTNVLRYGKHISRVRVEILHSPLAQEVTLRISDNGAETLAPSVGNGSGIPGMRERASIYAGRVTAGPSPHGGWQVEAVLHYSDAAGGAAGPPTTNGQLNQEGN